MVKLCKLELGDEVVIAKINQARTVDFRLDTDSLVGLKHDGVSKDVIAAMLKRATAGTTGAGPGTQPGGQGTTGAGVGAAANEGVWLRTQGSETALRSVQGDFSTTYAFVTVLFFVDFPGLHADLRITDPRPTVVVRNPKDPRGRVFLVKAESNKKDKNRSVKVGKGSPFGMKSWSTPDNDWTVECDVKALEPGLWELTPKSDLKKGEYGLLFKGGFLGTLGTDQAELFDFGVDR
ncbi:MAG TPA: hypothetical protein VMT45_13895 [Thermoanaerobaculaceae bacterium]|nr:hypothetical protein [Thermoanaerobaculaceae bacterium]